MPGRVVGLDLGARRIGVAVSDATGTLASPRQVLARTGDDDADRAAIAALVAEVGATRVVVGLPLSLNGRLGPAARAALAEADALGEVLAVPVETFDERLTTVTAHQRVAGSRRPSGNRRRVVDHLAAAVMLQHWLDGQ